jgi:4-hydroxy-tetrahydrodipicolinate reductase
MEITQPFSMMTPSTISEHKVNDRRVFAEGAIKAARWLVGQTPGFYIMQDVIQE